VKSPKPLVVHEREEEENIDERSISNLRSKKEEGCKLDEGRERKKWLERREKGERMSCQQFRRERMDKGNEIFLAQNI
jgi:hypothetical protein